MKFIKKSFSKLFFIIFMLIALLSSGAQKAKNEIEVLESLPKRERAHLDIEVNKVKSEKIEAQIDRKSKKIYVDFSKVHEKRKLAEPIDEERYEIFLFDSLENMPTYSTGKGRNQLNNLVKAGARMRNGETVRSGKFSYGISKEGSGRMLQASYDSEPESLYIGVVDKSTLNIAKVYKAELAVQNQDTEHTEVTINFSGGYTGLEVIFDPNGNIVSTVNAIDKNNTSLIKDPSGRFLTHFITGQSTIVAKTDYTERTGTFNPSGSDHYEVQLQVSADNRIYVLRFFKNGNFGIRLQQGDPKYQARYTINITHTMGSSVKNQILHINQGGYQPVPLMNREVNLPDLVIEDTGTSFETAGELVYGLGSVAMEQTGEGNVLSTGNPIPAIALGDSTWKGTGLNVSGTNARNLVKTSYKSSASTSGFELDMYFGGAGVIDKSSSSRVVYLYSRPGISPSVVGAYGSGAKERIDAGLYAKASTTVWNDLLKEARTLPGERAEFSSSSPGDQQISFVVGYAHHSNNVAQYIDLPAGGTLNNGESKIIAAAYPKIVINKVNKTNDVTFTIDSSYKLGTPITYTSSGTVEVVGGGVTAVSRNGYYLKSLFYDNYVTINDESGYLSVPSSGDSQVKKLSLTGESGKKAEIELKYSGRVPVINLISHTGADKYNFTIRHRDPNSPSNPALGLPRREYNVTIDIIAPPVPGTDDFNIEHNMPTEIMLREDGILEIPKIYVRVAQKTPSANIFPVIVVNDESKWGVASNTTFNPVDKRPAAKFDIGVSSPPIEGTVNIQETPLQNPEKFFVYERGALSKRNLGVGAFNNIDGTQNRVEVNFQFDLSKEVKDALIEYAATQAGSKVEIPFAAGEDHNIYIVPGKNMMTARTSRFIVPTEGERYAIPFPKIYILKGTGPASDNQLSVEFKNPVPKASGYKGTFTLDSDGTKAPQSMPAGVEHPVSAVIGGRSSTQWLGYTEISEKHRVEVYVNKTLKKSLETDSSGNLATYIEADGINFSFIKAAGRPAVLGVKDWNFAANEMLIELHHKNQYGRTVASDKYNVSIEAFNPAVYYDSQSSTISGKLDADKKLTVKASVPSEVIPLGTLQMFKYDRDITKTVSGFNALGEADLEGIRFIIADSVTLTDSSNSNNKVTGNLVLKNGNLEFHKTSGTIAAGKIYNSSANIGLVKIGRNPSPSLEHRIVESFSIDNRDNFDNNFSYDNQLGEIVINESEYFNGDSVIKTTLKSSGKITFTEKEANVKFPAIGVGTQTEWEYSGNSSNSTAGEIQNVKIKLGLEEIKIYPALVDVTGKYGLFKRNISFSNSARAVVVGDYTNSPNSYSNSISAALDISSSDNTQLLEKIREYAYKFPDDIVEMPYAGDYRISLIPSSTNNPIFSNPNKWYVPDTGYGNIREISYPKIKFIKKSGGETAPPTTGAFPYMSYSSTLKNLMISDDISISSDIQFFEIGSVSLQQSGSAPNGSGYTNYTFPSLALGENWRTTGNTTTAFENNRPAVNLSYSLEGTAIDISPEFIKPINTHKIYTQKTPQGNLLAIGSGADSLNGAMSEKIEGTVQLKIKKNELEDVIKKARMVSGERVQLISEHNQKITLIHSRYSTTGYPVRLPTDNGNVLPVNRVRYLDYPEIIIVKNSISKNASFRFSESYNLGEKVEFNSQSHVLPPGTETAAYEAGALAGLPYGSSIAVESEEGDAVIEIPQGQELITDASGNLKIESIKLKKGTNSLNLNLEYSNRKTYMWLSHISGAEVYKIKILHKDPSGDIRKTYNLTIATDHALRGRGTFTIDISPRYNPAEGEAVVFRKNGISYPSNTLAVGTEGERLLSPGKTAVLKISGAASSTIPLDNDGKAGRQVLTTAGGTQLAITHGSEGEVLIKPLYWDKQITEDIVFSYEVGGIEVGRYEGRISSPEFFAAMIGELDFGRLLRGAKNIYRETDLTLYYSSDINVEYSLDTETLELHDGGSLKVVNFKLGPERKNMSDPRERKVRLSGLITDTSNTPEGQYEKTVQLIIHMK